MATMQPAVVGFSWDTAVDLSRKENRTRLSPAAIKGVLRIATLWKLRDADTRVLLGGISSGSFYALKNRATRHEFHDTRGDPDFVDCLDQNSYAASQTLGLKLLTRGSAGIVYPSVRHKNGACIACFRPPLVLNVQEGPMVTFTFIDAEMTAVILDH